MLVAMNAIEFPQNASGTLGERCLGPFDTVVKIQLQRLKCGQKGETRPRTHQQEQRRRCFLSSRREPCALRLGQFSTAEGICWSQGRQGDWQEGACPIDARDAEILSFRETGSPCCVCVWRKLERKDPARVGGQGEGAGRQRQTRQSELGRGAPRPPWPMEHRSDTDPEAELVVSEKPLITCRHRG